MSRRLERINNLIRNTIGQLLLAKISDPRIDPARTSVTHVETADDLLSARVYISVMGTEGEQRRTLTALRHASGHIQERMMREIDLRSTPILTFDLDTKFKKTLETLQILQKVSQEIREKEEQDADSQAAKEKDAGDIKEIDV